MFPAFGANVLAFESPASLFCIGEHRRSAYDLHTHLGGGGGGGSGQVSYTFPLHITMQKGGGGPDSM